MHCAVCLCVPCLCASFLSCLHSTFTEVGAANPGELDNKWVRCVCTPGGWEEAHTHTDIQESWFCELRIVCGKNPKEPTEAHIRNIPENQKTMERTMRKVSHQKPTVSLGKRGTGMELRNQWGPHCGDWDLEPPTFTHCVIPSCLFDVEQRERQHWT